MAPRAVLVGLPGSGKTTVGRRLAALLEVPFADSDSLVEQRVGRPVPDIFAQDGEAAFRRWEAAAVSEALDAFDGVLALGGGAVVNSDTRRALRTSDVPVVLLHTRLPTLVGRLGDGHGRPLLAGDPLARLSELATARESLYREVVTVTVDTERRTARRVAEVIAGLLSVPTS